MSARSRFARVSGRFAFATQCAQRALGTTAPAPSKNAHAFLSALTDASRVGVEPLLLRRRRARTINRRPLRVALRERLESGRLHAPFRGELAHALDVHRAPDAPLPARRESDRVGGGVERSANAVDPSERQRFVEGFLIRELAFPEPFL